MNPATSLLTSFALVAAPLFAQASDQTPALWSFEIGASDAGLEHRLIGSQELFLGAVMISLSPRVEPYAKGLPPSLTDFVTLGACFGKNGQSFVFTSPALLLPLDVQIYTQAALLNSHGLQVSPVRGYRRAKTGLAIDVVIDVSADATAGRAAR